MKTMTYYYTPIQMDKMQNMTTPNADKDMEHQELSFIAGGNTERYSHLGDSLVISYKTYY